MPDMQLLQHASLVVAIGLLIGIQRGWQEREAHDGSRVAGIRTFTLISMLGGVASLLAEGRGPWVLAACFLGFALPYGLFEYRQASLLKSRSATNLIAGLLTFTLGAYAMTGSLTLAAALAVAGTVILAERQVMHAFLRRVKWKELRAALLLLVMTVILLPALPNHPVDPWGALNPYQIWLMTVLVGVVSYAGYIAIRIAGERQGLLYAGIMGGLVTSTTVTWTFARNARQNPDLSAEILAAILGAWIASLLRMAAIALSIAPMLAGSLLPPVLASCGILLLPATTSYLKAGTRHRQSNFTLHDPFELSLMAKFLLVLIVILILSKLTIQAAGDQGLLALGGLSGLLDVDPITLSSATMVREGLAPDVAARAILIAATANIAAKTFLGALFGGARLGMALASGAALAVGAGLTVMLL
jgi:uncharacterized membrane protein (DUF4010 family)